MTAVVLCRLFAFKDNPPFGGEELGAVAGEASLAGPIHYFSVPGGTGAEETLGRPDSGAVEVEAVGVPADPDGEGAGDEAVGVGFAGVGEQAELPFIQGKEPLLVEPAGQVGSPGSVAGVEVFVVPAGIVEDGKEFNDGEVGVGAVGQ